MLSAAPKLQASALSSGFRGLPFMHIDAPSLPSAGSTPAMARFGRAAILWPFAAMIVAMVFLQKFGLNIGDGAIGIDAFVLWGGLVWLGLLGYLEVVASRLVLLTLVVAAMLIGVMLNGQPLKPTALAVVLFMYAGFIFRMRLSPDLLRRCLLIFQRCMTVIAVIVILQQVVQYTVGHRFWPNLDALTPKAFLYGGFGYIHPYHWNSPYLEPNGIFFLEPSGLSAYLAMALLIELTWFRRFAHMGLYVLAILACLAGTGFLMLALVSPLLAFKLNRRMLLLVLALAIPVLGVALFTNWLAPLFARSSELSSSNSSGFDRIVLPLQNIASQLGDPTRIFEGAGPGQSLKGHDLVDWPFSKLLLEYGLLTAILFHAYLVFSVVGSAPSRTLAVALLLVHLFFGGGFVSHTNVMPLLLFCALPMVDPKLGEAVAAGRVRQRLGRAMAGAAATASARDLTEPISGNRPA